MAPGSLTITEGEDLLKAWEPEGGFAKIFCGECGSALFGRAPDAEEISLVRMGVIDGDPGIRLIARQYVADAAVWEPIPDDGLHRFDGPFPGA